MKLFDLKELERSEKDAIDKTSQNLGGIIDQYELIFDTFLKLPYFFGQIESVNTPLGSYQSFHQSVYCRLPYTMRIAYDLFIKAYYLEVEIIVRHLFEVLIIMRYFQSHPERLTPHLLSRTSKRDRVSFKTMFEEISPGFYDTYYGVLLSGASHGNLTAELFRIERSKSKSRVIMGCEFNLELAGKAVNQIMANHFGFFVMFRKIFPQNTLVHDEEMNQNYLKSIDWLDKALFSPTDNPNHNKWTQHIEKITGR